MGGSFLYIKDKNEEARHYNLFLSEYLGGAEFIFKNGNGFNVYGSAEAMGDTTKLITIGANYIYESRSAIKWAVLTGLDTGIEASSLRSELSPYVLRYNLGVRLRKNRHAISLNLKVPLFESTITWTLDGPEAWGQIKRKIYTGVVPTIRYTYFFGL